MFYNLPAPRYLEINLEESALLHVLPEDPASPKMINCIHLEKPVFVITYKVYNTEIY